MEKLDPVSRKNMENGLITDSAVSDFTLPKTAVRESINLHFDRIGSATLRKGSTILGNALSGNILGLYEFRDSGSGTNNQIVTVNDTVLYYLSGSTWTSRRTSLTAGSKARFTTFLDYLFMVNGTEATATWSGAAGDAFSTATNVTNAPTGKFIETFRSRVWIAGNSSFPDRLYYSSLPTKVATPAITWDTDVATGQWIDISPSDGENITGLKRSKASLLVFKPSHIYRVYSITETEPDPKINVGTESQESIVEAKDGVYFHHRSGFYVYSDGAVQEISKPIIDIVKNITLANFSKVAGWLETDGDHVCWSVGSVTVGDITYSNTVVRYTISSKTWTLYSYPFQFLNSSNYNDGSNVYIVIGNTNGEVLKYDTGNTDNATAISYSLIHAWDLVDGSAITEKNVTSMVFLHDGGAGTNVQYQTDYDLESDWTRTLGQFTDTYLEVNKSLKFSMFRPRIAGSSRGEPFSYDGYEILEGTSD